jgi:phosphoribosylformylglycinamidine synthase I
MKPKVLIFAGYGLNCDDETKMAFETAGASADIVHINDIIANIYKLSRYQIIVFQGGFAYGDDTGSGNAYALRVRNHLWKDIVAFVKSDKLVIGICNGFQILTNLGLIPAINGEYGVREIVMTNNDNVRYTVRWVDMKVENNSPWLSGIQEISLPIAHGEGKLFTSNSILKKMKKKNMIALRYIKGNMCNLMNLPANPNGSLENIAGITDESGRILGIMPHPERAQFFQQLPNWTYLKEKFNREGKKLPVYGPGINIFINAVKYFN